MYIHHDEDEWQVKVTHRPCTGCDGDRSRCHGQCNGMSGYSLVRRDPAEVKKIKDERRRKRENDILAEAEAIIARRRRNEPIGASLTEMRDKYDL
jgi:hypothetical protein